ncbi:15656_t:CDS:2 [Funneliformis geosporum]|uniref:15656_t:CDS:1 n=1 Tax=Funneliformis geosporum TaxID=1117311 RepID=A0A9W4WKR6_9GLOM|nr:15656_t:CDS:2 [Funneliformis geosporum]
MNESRASVDDINDLNIQLAKKERKDDVIDQDVGSVARRVNVPDPTEKRQINYICGETINYDNTYPLKLLVRV